jgi:hypothetical protein
MGDDMGAGASYSVRTCAGGRGGAFFAVGDGGLIPLRSGLAQALI